MGVFEGKTLLVLGGLALEIEAIKYAKERGARVVVADYYPDAPAKKYADVASIVSATDIDALVELCRKESVDGVFTGYADVLLPYYAELCSRLNLPCYGNKALFDVMTDKAAFKSACRKHGVPTVPEYSFSDILNDCATYPVLVKPTDSSGSRGITECASKNDVDRALGYALKFSKSNSYLIERFMTGDEVVMYYYCQDGTPVFMGMCDRYVNREQAGLAQLPTAYVFPSKHTSSHLNSGNALILEMLKSMGMQNGPLFLQAFVEDGEPLLYEPGYRLCGAREHVIYSAVEGVNSEHMLVDFALTGSMADYRLNEVADPLIDGKWACKLSPLIRVGEVGSINGLSVFDDLPQVVGLFFNNAVGDEVLPEEVGTLRQIAYRAYLVCDSISELADTIELIQNNVVYRDIYGEAMMMEQFDVKLLAAYDE